MEVPVEKRRMMNEIINRLGCLRHLMLNAYQKQTLKIATDKLEQLQAERNQVIKFLEDALPHIECKNDSQSSLITTIGEFLSKSPERQ